MSKDHGPTIKDDKRYEALRKTGMSKEKAPRISNSPASETGKKGGEASSYEGRNKTDLLEKAKEVGIAGITKMNKAQLIDALRRH